MATPDFQRQLPAGHETGTGRGVFGYLPGHPDLVRVRASSREVRALEGWIERGLHQARWEMGSGFFSAYPWLTHRFVFRPDNASQALLGVVYASQDCHGRPFPFVAFEPLPTPWWDDASLDIVRWNEPLFDELEALVQDVAALPQLGQVHSRVLHGRMRLAAEPQHDPEALARSDTRYQNFLEEVVCGELGPPGTGAAVCRDLMALLRSDGPGPRDPRSIRAAIEVPLHRPPLARALELRFYLELCSLLLAPARPTLTLFWKLGGPAVGSLILCFREPTIDVFCGLLRRGSPSRGVARPGREEAGAGLASAVRIREDMPLRALLESLDPYRSRTTTEAAAAASR
jgi:type VI secretion system ImpM family protein